MMKRYIIVVLLFNYSNSISQQIVQSRRTDWSKAGSCFTQNDSTVNIMKYGGDSLGIMDNSSAFNLAKAAISSTGGTVFFPRGKFKFTYSITLINNITVKGNGANSTLLEFNLSGSNDLFKITGTIQNSNDTVISGYTKGSKSIKVNDASLYSIGNYIKLYENNNSRTTSSWASKSIGQIVKITNINTTTDSITFDQELRMTFTNTLFPRIQKINAIKNVGFECFSIKRLDQTSSHTANFFFNFAANCYVKGIESDKCNFSHIKIQNSTNVKVSESYFTNGHSYGGGGKAYGVAIQSSTGNCLIENNQFNHLRHSILLQAGANGNVIGYNYSKNPYWTGVFLPSNSAGDLVLHGNYVFMNLFEGNICQNIVIDNSHGINGPYNTFFRNRSELYGIFMNSGAGSSQNFVGNEVTNNSTGLYNLTGTGHFQYGNNHRGTIKPVGTTGLIKNSYYLKHKPIFWSPTEKWSNIGNPNPYNQLIIPAKKNNLDTIFSICYEDTLLFNELICYDDSLEIGGKYFYGNGVYSDSTVLNTGCIKQFKLNLTKSLKPTITKTWFLESSKGDTYQWFKNGQLIIGDTMKIMNFNQTGYYQVQVKDSNGCTAISDSLYVFYNSLSHIFKNTFKIYPNPTSKQFIISFDNESDTKIKIFDLVGKLVLEKEISNKKTIINISHLTKGVYYLETIPSNKKRKIIVY